MRLCLLLLPAVFFLPSPAAAEEPSAGLAKEVAELKRQVAALAADPGRGLKIGAVNIVRVFDELDEKVDMNAELRQLEEKRGAKIRELGEQVRNLDEKAKLLRPDTDEARDNAKLLEEAGRAYRAYRDETEDQLYNKLYDFTLNIYKKIRDEVEAYAREGTYDIVLRTRDIEIGDVDQGMRPRTRYMELNRRIEGRTVLFHRPAFDFTKAMIERMNAKNQRTKAEREKLQPGGAMPPPPESK